MNKNKIKREKGKKKKRDGSRFPQRETLRYKKKYEKDRGIRFMKESAEEIDFYWV